MSFKMPKFAKMMLVGIIASFGFGFSHAALPMSEMSSADMGTTPAECQILCLSAILADKEQGLRQVVEDDQEPEPQFFTALSMGALLFAGLFVVKRIVGLSSWRPPDLVLLHGHYADGL